MPKLAADSTKRLSPGLTVFDALRAEDEPWLAECYIEPADFELIAGASSVAVFGAGGSGKTALYRRLREYFTLTDSEPARLVFEWTPGISAERLQSSEAADAEWCSVLREIARALVTHIGRHPEAYNKAATWAKRTMRWLAHRWLGNELRDTIAAQLKKTDPTRKSALGDLADGDARNPFLDHAPAKGIAAELVKAIDTIGLSSVCVLVSPETFAGRSEPPASLSAFLSTLEYFETPGFLFKFIFPAVFERRLSAAGAMKTRRIALTYLRWQPDELTYILEARLNHATGGQVSALSEVCVDDHLIDYLMRVGGELPRGWLEQARPLVAHYLQRMKLGKPKPITAAEWSKIRVAKPPRLTVDLASGDVVSGHRAVDLPEVELTLLKYLYQNRGRVCTRDELYHEAYLSLAQTLKPGARQAFSKEYRDVIDTAIWRLRNAIEPDPKKPLFVVTKKGQGVELKNAW